MKTVAPGAVESVECIPLLVLAKALQHSDITLQKVHKSGYEWPAEGKFAVLECPRNHMWQSCERQSRNTEELIRALLER